MSRRVSRPDGALGGLSTGSGDPWTDGAVLVAAAGCAVSAVGAVVWTTGTVLSFVSGHGTGPSLVEAASRLRDGGLEAVWPGVPAPLVVVASAVLVAVLALGVMTTSSALRARFAGKDGFAGERQLRVLLGGKEGVATARRLRPTLGRSNPLSPGDRGLPLGVLLGTRQPSSRSTTRPTQSRMARATWEDVVLAICAPRSGKTTCLAIPAVLDAPGAVVATSNKADLWEATASPRRTATGERVWTFDPQNLTGGGRGFVWNPLDGVNTVADARRLASHFIQEVRSGRDGGDFWDRDAEDLLSALLLAASLAQAPLSQVAAWLTASSSVEPRNVLSRNGFGQLADSLTGRSQGAHETREGVYATARAAAACLTDPEIMAWTAPTPALDTFDPEAFVTSRQTLFLLSKDSAGSAAPLVAAFADRVMLEAVRAAEAACVGRLDPPLVAVLDEAANICRIADLPRLYSHLGSRGVVPLTILQSRAQGRRVWGEAGMDELFSASTVKVIGAGIDDPAFAEDLSKLVGEEDVITMTHSQGKSSGTSRTVRRERVLPADQVRAMPKFTALLLVTGIRPARLQLVPWMSGPHRRVIEAALASRSRP